MLPPGSPAVWRSLTALALTLAGVGMFSVRADAQQQERKLLDRIEHPDRTLHAEGFDKAFATNGPVGDKQASVRSFAFGGKTATLKAGDGAFHARSFASGRDGFRTDSFTVKHAAVADREVAQADHPFATKALPVREDPLAHKSTPYDRPYVNASKPYLIPGRRQDTIDDLRQQKNLSVDEVRDILNKGTDPR